MIKITNTLNNLVFLAPNPQGAGNAFLDFFSYACGVLGILWAARGGFTVASGIKTENPQKADEGWNTVGVGIAVAIGMPLFLQAIKGFIF